jgi:5'(3')-deoxyribonucleotidase
LIVFSERKNVGNEIILRENDIIESNKSTGSKIIFDKKKNSYETTFRKSLRFLNIIEKEYWLAKNVAVSDFIAASQLATPS